MPDPRFYPAPEPIAVGALAARIGAELAAGSDAGRMISGAEPLESASEGDLSFFGNRKYTDHLERTRAGAVVLAPAMRGRAPAAAAPVLAADPYRAYARATQLLYPARRIERPGAAPGAHIDPSAVIGPDCQIDAGAVLAERAEIGARCRIGANAVIGAGVIVGDDCAIGAGAALSHCLIGNRVVLHPGVCIGQDGFGFAMSAEGHETIVQLGRVIVGDEVEIGANTTVDRGSGPDTVIGAGTRIDNLVQIAHNVRIGRNCALAAQSGIAGSTHIGDSAVLAGQAGIANHLRIGDGAKIGGQSGVMRNLPAGARVAGTPARPGREFFRLMALWNRQANARKRKKP